MRKIIQNSFLGGQLDFEMMGRQDIEKYAKGATTLRNFVPIKRGGIRKRSGTNLVFDVSDVSGIATKRRLVPFAYTETMGFCLLFTPNAITAFSRDINSLEGDNVTVTTSGSAQFYGADAIDDFDYCQCGDVLFLAHPDYPPMRIEHRVKKSTVDGQTITVHKFTLKRMDFSKPSQAIPEITNATVNKQGVIDIGGVATERYVVSAVFDGVETFPSEEYFGTTAADDVHSGYGVDSYNAYKAAAKLADDHNLNYSAVYDPPSVSYNGTSYHMPWTASQTISLEIIAKKRSDGYWPEQLRIYKKSGGLYGLVGTIDTSGLVSTPIDEDDDDEEEESGTQQTSIVTEPAGGSGQTSFQTGIIATSAPVAYNYPAQGHTIYGENLPLTFTLPEPAVKAKVTIYPGYTTRTQTTDQNTGLITSLTYAFTHGGFASATLKLGDQSLPSTKKRSKTQSFTTTGLRNCSITINRTDISNLSVDPATDVQGANEEFMAAADKQAANFITNTSNARNELSVEITNRLSNSNATTLLSLEIGFTGGGLSSSAALRAIVVEYTNAGNGSGYSSGGADYGTQTLRYTWTDKFYTPDVSVTPTRKVTVMSEPGEYPSSVCLSQQRLIWASTKNDPARIFMSQIGDFYAYAPHDVMVADDPIDFQMASTRFPKVNHMTELRKLIVFNGDAEWVLDSASATSAITYETAQARQHSAIGADPRLKPLVCNNVLLFAERTGQAVRQYGYALEDDGYGGVDVSIFSSSVFRDRKIVAWAFQQHPNSTCWCVLSDGSLCSLTFMREQNTVAWATHALGGCGKARAIACTHALIGDAEDNTTTSQVFLLVQRGNVWTIEEMRPDVRHGGHSVNHAVCMDCVVKNEAGDEKRTYTWTENGVQRTVTTTCVNVYTGAVQNNPDASTVEGFPFDCEFTSVHPVTGSEVGLAQMDVKCVQHAHLRLADTVGGKVRAIGVPENLADAFEGTELEVEEHKNQQNTAYTDYGTVHLKTVDVNVPMRGDNSRDGRITVTQDGPWPITVLMLETDIECEQEGRR